MNALDNAEPCPFCGSIDLDFQAGNEDQEGVPVSVICTDCAASGPYVYLDPEIYFDRQNHTAITAWNTRHKTPEASQ